MSETYAGRKLRSIYDTHMDRSHNALTECQTLGRLVKSGQEAHAGGKLYFVALYYTIVRMCVGWRARQWEASVSVHILRSVNNLQNRDL